MTKSATTSNPIRKRYDIGVVFAIPLPDGRFAYGKQFRDATVGVYRVVTSKLIPITQIVGKRFAFHAGLFRLRMGQWPILGLDKFASDEASWAPACYMEEILRPGSFSIYHRGTMRPATPSQVASLDEQVMYSPQGLIERILSERWASPQTAKTRISNRRLSR